MEQAASLSTTLLAIHPEAVAALGAWMAMDDADEDDECDGFERCGDVAVVTVEGPLMQRGSWWRDGYEAVQRRIASAMADGATTAVLLKINSPGGVCAGMSEAFKAIRASRTKPVIAYADEVAYSAAYGLACCADEIWVPESGGVGSVGVLTTRVDATEALKLEGVRVEVVAIGDRKADGMPATQVTEAELKRIRESAQKLADIFADQVGEARKMTREQVLALEAGCFMGADAVAAGLADKVGGLADAIARASTRGAKTMSRKATEKTTMKQLFVMLGLAESAGEAEAVAAVSEIKGKGDKLSALHTSLAGLTGKSAPDEIVGAVAGWKAGSEQAAKASADLAEANAKLATFAEKAKADEIASVFEEGRRAGKLTAAQEGWAKSMSAAGLRSFLETAPVVVQREETKAPPADAGASAAALTADDILVASKLGMTVETFADWKSKSKKGA